jgi:hypothetical protein
MFLGLPNPLPDPLVRRTDARIRIRTKMLLVLCMQEWTEEEQAVSVSPPVPRVYNTPPPNILMQQHFRGGVPQQPPAGSRFPPPGSHASPPPPQQQQLAAWGQEPPPPQRYGYHTEFRQVQRV